MSISNFDIDKFLSKEKKYQGTVIRQDITKDHKTCIINLGDRDTNGTHWVCMYGGNEYFDSFGLPPPEEVAKVMNRPAIYNSSRFQMSASKLCGFYCMYYIMERNTGVSARDIVYKFEQHADNFNEEIILNYF